MDELKVGGQPVDRYIANFNWEHAKYPQRRTLPELVALIQVRMEGREGGRERREGNPSTATSPTSTGSTLSTPDGGRCRS